MFLPFQFLSEHFHFIDINSNFWNYFYFRFFTASASQRDSSSSKDNNPGAYGSKQNALDLDAFKVGPYFDKAASKNITALLGKTAYLNCRVKNLNKTAVSFSFFFFSFLFL